jgi:hypothetical protein
MDRPKAQSFDVPFVSEDILEELLPVWTVLRETWLPLQVSRLTFYLLVVMLGGLKYDYRGW